MMANREQNQNMQQSEEHFLTYEEILEEYRRRQMIEHLTGPVISLILHVIVVGLLAFFLAGRETVTTAAEMEFDVREMEIQPIDPELLDDLEDIDPEIEPRVPTVEPPEIDAEAMEAEDIEDFAEDMADVDVDMDFAQELDVRPSRSPLVLPEVMGSRGDREEALREHAGRWAEHTERSVVQALEFLKNSQDADGSWPNAGGPKASNTGLAVLAFLAHNELPGESDEYDATVRKGIEFLIEQIEEDGFSHTSRPGAYTNGIVAYALAEAYAMTRIPKIRPAAEEALQRIVDGQQPEGGFDYGYSKGDRWDYSVTAWQAQALKAGYMSGVEVSGIAEAMDKIIDFTKNVAFTQTGGFGYSSPGGGSPAVQGGGTLALQLLGEGNSPEARTGVDIIDDYRVDRRLDWGRGQDRFAYEVYYMTQAIFHAGTRYFQRWNNELAPSLVRNQRPDGSWRSPAGADAGGWQNCPVMNTTLNAMSLMVYYRFLPTFQDPEEREETTDIFELDEEELSLEH